MKYKNIYACILAAFALSVSSCSDKWEEEQYEHYISFKAPTTNSTVTQLRVKYNQDGTHYRLPLIVSGSTNNDRDIDVHVGVDSDTLQIYNVEHFGEGRKDLWFKELSSQRYVFNPVTHISAGENTALVDIQLDFNGLDFSEKWVLPLIVEDDPSYGYQSHPRLGYNNALLWFTPFNDYSGTYQTTALSVYAGDNEAKLNLSTRNAYVVDENSIFFYAGAIDEDREDRKFFKLKAVFVPDPDFVQEEGSSIKSRGTVLVEPMNNIAKLNFYSESQPTYIIEENMDTERPLLLRRTLTIQGLKYTFNDPLETNGNVITYRVDGNMSLQRNINTAIPDEEFAIEW